MRQPQIFIWTGAGLSAAAELPLFRGESQALWRQLAPRMVCHIRGLSQNYGQTHEFFNDLRRRVGLSQPTRAHQAIARLVKLCPQAVTLASSNIDDLQQRAGLCDEEFTQLHGNICRVRDMKTDRSFDVRYEPIDWKAYPAVRPDVLLYGEPYGPELQALTERLAQLRPGDLLLSIGSSDSVFNPSTLVSSGVTKVAVNPDPEYLERAAGTYCTALPCGADEFFNFAERLLVAFVRQTITLEQLLEELTGLERSDSTPIDAHEALWQEKHRTMQGRFPCPGSLRAEPGQHHGTSAGL